jgi:hypothetical protein
MSSAEETIRHYRTYHGIELDKRFTSKLYEIFDEEGEGTDGELREEKATDEEGGEEEMKDCPTPAGLGLDSTGRKKRLRTEGENNETPGPTSHKKARR